MPVSLAVALAGAVGASARYGLDLLFTRDAHHLPWVTFAISRQRVRWRRPIAAGSAGSQRLKNRYAQTASTALASGTPVQASANETSTSTVPAPPSGRVLRVSAYPVAYPISIAARSGWLW